MVRTNDSPAVAGTDEQRVRSMAAYIIEGAQCPALIANDQNALVKDLAHVVIAGVGEVRCVALIRPRSEENGLLLPVEHFRFVVPPGGERGERVASSLKPPTSKAVGGALSIELMAMVCPACVSVELRSEYRLLKTLPTRKI